ncbi:MAG: GyrI-like domain-containing protein [Bacteroidales bacterium]|nr:GyrI-like domain-containing protein [Bacteroidales bacterium]MDD6751568.1 GyrI-like domain-containing protein [Bacteroidales bacterium]MDY2878819.1 GyrI-like domain-containing protein [Candidatus Cryptobacteroides sp.]
MAFDFKKEYKEFFLPPVTPTLVDVPPANYIAISGTGNPNDEGSEYKDSIGLLYGIAFTIKMSKKGGRQIEGYFDYVVPPLEGLWWSENGEVNYAHKEAFHFISMIRLPEFVTRADFDWAVAEATRKKKTDFSKVEFFHYEEGRCVQCMHIGPFDSEPITIGKMKAFAEQQGLSIEMDDVRRHHEIYLSDPRKTAADKLKTVIRYPVK